MSASQSRKLSAAPADAKKDYDHQFNVVITGTRGSGRAALLRAFAGQSFVETDHWEQRNYYPYDVLVTVNGLRVQLQINITDKDHYHGAYVFHSLIRTAQAHLIVADLTDGDSFDIAKGALNESFHRYPKKIRGLFGLKSDRVEDLQVSYEHEVVPCAKEYGAVCSNISAKDLKSAQAGLEEIARELVKPIMAIKKHNEEELTRRAREKKEDDARSWWQPKINRAAITLLKVPSDDKLFPEHQNDVHGYVREFFDMLSENHMVAIKREREEQRIAREENAIADFKRSEEEQLRQDEAKPALPSASVLDINDLSDIDSENAVACIQQELKVLNQEKQPGPLAAPSAPASFAGKAKESKPYEPASSASVNQYHGAIPGGPDPTACNGSTVAVLMARGIASSHPSVEKQTEASVSLSSPPSYEELHSKLPSEQPPAYSEEESQLSRDARSLM